MKMRNDQDRIAAGHKLNVHRENQMGGGTFPFLLKHAYSHVLYDTVTLAAEFTADRNQMQRKQSFSNVFFFFLGKSCIVSRLECQNK